MNTTHQTATARLTGVLMTTALTAMLAGAAVVVPSALTLNPADPAAVLWVPVWGGAPMSAGVRRVGVLAALSGLVAVVLPWTTGADGLSAAAGRLGCAFHLPIMTWCGAQAWRDLRPRPAGAVDGGR
ncbi:hypothetical protein AB0K14_21445 [Actinosynnema sp. NPDC050801]|uniref:hypothetical protein n=1 Tax=unclassified Actinosynnema TaxID=2637065 RepID=UPI0033F37110